MDLFTQLYWLRRFGNVQRFHGQRLTRDNTVFHHSCSVAVILIQIYGELCSSNLLRAVLQHDLEEGVTGDIPAPVKWKLNSESIQQMEIEVREYYHIKHPELTEEETKMLKAADFVDAVLFLLEERLSGNQDANWLFDNYRLYASKSGIVEQFPEMRHLWYEILDSYQEITLEGKTPSAVKLAQQKNFWAK